MVHACRSAADRPMAAIGWAVPADHRPGDIATGLVAVGGVAIGLFSVGGVAVGLVALGAVAIGLVAVGAVAIGLFAAGAVAIGLTAMGCRFGRATRGLPGHRSARRRGSWESGRPRDGVREFGPQAPVERDPQGACAGEA